MLSRLGQRLEATVDPRAVLPAVVETVAQALKVPHAAIELKREGGFETAGPFETGEWMIVEVMGRHVLPLEQLSEAEYQMYTLR